MQVNELIYGLKENWTPRNLYGDYPENYPEDEKLKIANFLNNPLTTSGDTRNGCCIGSAFYMQTQTTSPYYNPTFDYGQPIPDMSICFTGLSGFSPYLNIRFISTRTDATDDEEYQLTEEATQIYDVFNFCYNTVLGASFGDQQKCFALDKNETVGPGDSELNVKLYDTRLYPEPINKGLPSRQLLYCYTPKSSRNTITFVTQLPVKHIVLIPFITARDANGNFIKHDLKTYVTEDKVNYPRIVDITLRTYSSTTDTHFNYGQQLAINNFNIYTALSDYYGQAESGATHRIKQANLVIPFIPCQGIKIGGCITGDDLERYQKTDTSVLNHVIAMYAYIDCVNLRWDSYSGDGTPMTNHYCYCDASRYTVEEIYDSIYKATACFGLFFTDSSSDVYNMYLDDEEMCLGILRDGIGYGQWTSGVRNRTQPQWNWKDMRESPYEPSEPKPTTNWQDDMSLAYVDNSILTANKWYLISNGTPNSLTFIQFMGLINDVDLETYDKNATFGLNPIDGVLQARCIYVSHSAFEEHLYYTQEDHIEIGKLSLPLIGQMEPAYKIESHNIATYICANKVWLGEFYEDFRNYSPYAKISFYDAFCGSIEIDPSKIMNKYISIIQSVNLLSGDKITSLYVTENPNISNYGIRIATLHGNCSFEIPINGLAVADYARNQYLLSQKITTDSSELASTASMGFGGASISAITGNPIGALAQSVGTIANTYTAYTNLQTDKFLKSNTTPSPVKVSNGSSSVEIGVIYNPCIVLSIPKMDDNFTPSAEDEYSILTGFAGFKIATPNSLGSGTHVFDRPRINISGTVLEQMALIDQLEKGIYIKP